MSIFYFVVSFVFFFSLFFCLLFIFFFFFFFSVGERESERWRAEFSFGRVGEKNGWYVRTIARTRWRKQLAADRFLCPCTSMLSRFEAPAGSRTGAIYIHDTPIPQIIPPTRLRRFMESILPDSVLFSAPFQVATYRGFFVPG